MENQYSIAIFDKSPVSMGHTLIIVKRHVANYFEMTEEEKLAVLELTEQMKIMLDGKYQPTGYNIGVNCGEDAVQTINHMHLHLIPRYKGDVADPAGGVRGVIPEKQHY